MTPIPFDVATTPLATGTTLIAASAGTGKTYCVSHLVARVLLERPHLDPTQVLVVTFTNAATAELASRIREVLVACRAAAQTTESDGGLPAQLVAAHCERYPLGVIARLDDCVLRSDELPVSTIHGFCKRVLEQSAFAGGEPFAAELTDDAHGLIRAAVHDVWRARLHGDVALAAIAVAAEWSVDADERLCREAQQHAALVVEPRDATLSNALAQVAVALCGLVPALSAPGFEDLLASAPWNAGGAERFAPAELARMRAELSTVSADINALPQAIAALRALAEVVNAIKKNTKVGKALAAQVRIHPLPLACAAVLSALDGTTVAWQVELIRAVGQRLAAIKTERQVLTHDDLLRRLDGALSARPELSKELRDRYAVALIDESQDTDPVQCRIFERLFGDRELVLIGDPKQSIYRFRGADLRAYLDAAGHAAIQATLATNHRSAPALVQAVNHLFGAAPLPFLEPSIPYAPVAAANKPRAELVDADADIAACHWWLVDQHESGFDPHAAVGAEILRLLTQAQIREISGEIRALQPADCAVLVRANHQAEALRDHLATLGIPAVVAANGDVLARDEARALALLLSAALNPREGRTVRAAFATLLWGDDAATLGAIAADAKRWQAAVDRLVELARDWQRRGVAAACERLFGERKTWERLAALPDGERRLTDLRHALELVHARQAANGWTPSAVVRWLERREQDDDREARELRLESDAAAVRILTVHRSKGLEFPVVFCPWLWKAGSQRRAAGVLAHDADGTLVLDLGSPYQADRAEAAAYEDLAEEVRLAYVALTRAALRCYVLWGACSRSSSDSLRSGLGWLTRPAAQDYAGFQALLADEDERKAYALTTTVEELVADHPGVMSCSAPLLPASERWQPPLIASADWQARILSADSRAQLVPWTVASYSSLVRTRRDQDDELVEPAPRPVVLTAASAPLATLLATPLAGFAAGRDAGVCLHEMLEHWDGRTAPEALAINESLERSGLPSGSKRHQPDHDPVAAVQKLCADLAALRLPDTNYHLADIAADRRFAEWPFHLPLISLSPLLIAEVLADTWPEVHARCGAALAALGDHRAQGFLTGVIDLVWEHEGRWHLLDWKSDRLGTSAEAYRGDALWSAMNEGHYVLQAVCYLLALHRFLRSRLPDYAYDRHIAGAWYVFLRGVDGEPDHGVLRVRPPLATIEALEQLLVPVLVEMQG